MRKVVSISYIPQTKIIFFFGDEDPVVIHPDDLIDTTLDDIYNPLSALLNT